LPLGAFAGRDEIIGVLAHDPPLGHITTFGGHPLSCAAGLAALNIIVDENLSARAATTGDYLRRLLTRLQAPEIAAIRGIGLLVGIEFHSAEFAHRFVEATIERGVIVNWTLNADNVVRLAPPLAVSIDEVDFAIAAMRDALEAARTASLKR
jgi:acetylornithine/N-succinyldiaminopimelate aminotransferase